jgi:hypothetical protein
MFTMKNGVIGHLHWVRIIIKMVLNNLRTVTGISTNLIIFSMRLSWLVYAWQVMCKMSCENACECTPDAENGLRFLQQYHKEGDELLSHIIWATRHKTWVSFANVTVKDQSKLWMDTFTKKLVCQKADCQISVILCHWKSLHRAVFVVPYVKKIEEIQWNVKRLKSWTLKFVSAVAVL